MKRVKLAYCPTRRDVFSREEAMKFNEIIRRQLDEFDVEIVDLEGINEEKLLFSDSDIDAVIDRFASQKVDAIFFPHCNFGSENRVAQVAKALDVPVLIWGREMIPRIAKASEAAIRSAECLLRERCFAGIMLNLHILQIHG